LEDMLRYADRILRHAAGGREVFDDQLSRDGILFELAVIGEAANRTSEQLRQGHPNIPWRRIIDQRNIVVHVYDQIDVDRIWVAVEALSDLRRQLIAIVEGMGKS